MHKTAMAAPTPQQNYPARPKMSKVLWLRNPDLDHRYTSYVQKKIDIRPTRNHLDTEAKCFMYIIVLYTMMRLIIKDILEITLLQHLVTIHTPK